MSNRVRGDLPPAPRMRGHLLRVTSSEAMQLVCYSSSVFGKHVHWWGNRSHECKHDKARCEGCMRGWPSRWKGYLHVGSANHGGDVFLELTATAWALIESQLPEDETARGIIFKIRRTKGGSKGRYIVEVLERRLPDAEMPQEKDPLQLLRFLWSAKRSAGREPE